MHHPDDAQTRLSQDERKALKARFPGHSMSNTIRLALGLKPLKHGGYRQRRAESMPDANAQKRPDQENR